MKSFPVLALALLFLAGCSGQNAGHDDATDEPTAAGPLHALAGAVEPAGFDLPTFRLPPPLALGGPLYGAGEPSIVAGLDGSLYVSFPGCDDGPYYFVSYPGSETCAHGLVYKSTDLAESWTRLNRHPDGRLTDDGPEANGDADVTVDSAGTVYASNLGGGGIQFHRSLDGGRTWQYMANIVPPTEDDSDDPDVHEGADRQWLAAAGPGHVINAWMRTSPKRDVELNTTFDGGGNWTGNLTFGDNIGWLGSVQFAPDGMHAYVPYTQPEGGPIAVGLGIADHFTMHVLRTADGGLTWDDVDTGMAWDTTVTGAHWSGGHMAPTLDVTGDGTIVVAMAVDNWITPTGTSGLPAATNQGTVLILRYSRDGGATWSETQAFGQNSVQALSAFDTFNLGERVFPWVTGGAGDRFAITFFASPAPVDSDVAGTVWSLHAIIVDGAADGELRMQEAVIDPNVHEGAICTRGGLCGGPGDRTLLDYFESDLTPDGRLVVVYPSDTLTQAGPSDTGGDGKDIQIRVAVQDGGTFLLERPAQA